MVSSGQQCGSQVPKTELQSCSCSRDSNSLAAPSRAVASRALPSPPPGPRPVCPAPAGEEGTHYSPGRGMGEIPRETDCAETSEKTRRPGSRGRLPGSAEAKSQGCGQPGASRDARRAPAAAPARHRPFKRLAARIGCAAGAGRRA